MIRLAVSVEGQTEDEFIRKVLAAHLHSCDVLAQPVLLGRARRNAVGGGDVTVERLVSDMVHLWHSFDVVTSLVDFYGFRDTEERSAEELEDLCRDEIEGRIGYRGDKVVPYVQKHEFEGLLFSQVCAFRVVQVPSEAIETLKGVRRAFPNPEDINDNRTTAPSKRIAQAVPRYRKRLHGPLIAEEIGVDRIRADCPRFDAWIGNLENLQDRI